MNLKKVMDLMRMGAMLYCMIDPNANWASQVEAASWLGISIERISEGSNSQMRSIVSIKVAQTMLQFQRTRPGSMWVYLDVSPYNLREAQSVGAVPAHLLNIPVEAIVAKNWGNYY